MFTKNFFFNNVSGTVGGGYDPDAQSFFNRVTTAGGTLTSTEMSAVNQLVLDLKSASLWTSMKAIYPMVGSSSAACSQNLFNSSFTSTFNGTWTFANTGVSSDGSTAYMNSGLNLNTQTTLYDVHYSYYVRNNSASGIDIGVTSAGFINEGWSAAKYANGGSNAFGGFYNNDEAGVRVANSDSRGFYVSSVTSSTLTFLTKNSSLLGQNTNTITATPANAQIILGAVNNVGTPIEFSSREYAFMSIGDGLSEAEAYTFYTAVQAFQTTLGRQV